MPDSPAFHKFPEDSTSHEYDIFEEFPDGSTVWQACVFGMDNVEAKFRELGQNTTNRLFAVNLQDRSGPLICSGKRRAS